MGRLPTGSRAPTLVIDPTQPKLVYAATDTGVYRSEDAGWTWAAASQGLPPRAILSLAIDPRRTDRLFAATETGEIYRTGDRGGSWELVGSQSPSAQG